MKDARYIGLRNLCGQSALTARDMVEYWYTWAGDDPELAGKVAIAEAALRAIHAHTLPLCVEYDRTNAVHGWDMETGRARP